MAPNGVSHHDDANWLRAAASRFDQHVGSKNTPDFAALLKLPPKITDGREIVVAQRDSIYLSERLDAIANGFASQELPEFASKASWEKDEIDFDAPSGMIADLKTKSGLVATEIFHPLVSGFGVTNPAALEPYRTFTIEASRPAIHRLPIGR